jgi:hypothetical protein
VGYHWAFLIVSVAGLAAFAYVLSEIRELQRDIRCHSERMNGLAPGYLRDRVNELDGRLDRLYTHFRLRERRVVETVKVEEITS